jgi:hypothetical protein
LITLSADSIRPSIKDSTIPTAKPTTIPETKLIRTTMRNSIAPKTHYWEAYPKQSQIYGKDGKISKEKNDIESFHFENVRKKYF